MAKARCSGTATQASSWSVLIAFTDMLTREVLQDAKPMITPICEDIVGEHLREGEYYLLQKPPEKNLSICNEQKHPNEVFQDVITLSKGSANQMYTLCDSPGQRDDGLVRLVTAERLTPIAVLPAFVPASHMNA